MPIHYEEMTKALRRELVPFKAHLVPLAKGDIASALYTGVDREVVVLDYDSGQVGKLDLDTLSFKWLKQYNCHFVFGDYHPTYGVVAPSVSPGAIVLMDEEGNITKSITSTSLGALVNPRSCRWHFPDGRIWFVDGDTHVAGLLDPETGTVTNQFGVYGVSGSDLTHLHNPNDIDFTVKSGGSLNKIFVADTGNNRVLWIDASTMTVNYIWLMRVPFSCRILRDAVNGRYGLYDDYNRSTICFGSRSWVGQGLNMVVQGDGTRLYGFVPVPNFDCPNLDPYSLRLVNTCAAKVVYEWDLSGLVGKKPNPFSTEIIRDVTIGAGATYPTAAEPYATLMNGFGFDRISLKVYSTQAATLYIDVPNKIYTGNASLYVPTDFSWVEYDSRSIATGMTTYIFSSPPPVFRVRIVMGGTQGTVSIYADGA
jgi:hypothetical protein